MTVLYDLQYQYLKPNLTSSHCWASKYINKILQKFHFIQILCCETKKANYSEDWTKPVLSANWTSSSSINLYVWDEHGIILQKINKKTKS